MADNVAVTPGLGATIATDDIGGVQYQIVKLTQGVLDSQTLVSVSNGLPVAGAQQGSPVYVSPGLKTTETFTRAAISFAASGDNIPPPVEGPGLRRPPRWRACRRHACRARCWPRLHRSHPHALDLAFGDAAAGSA